MNESLGHGQGANDPWVKQAESDEQVHSYSWPVGFELALSATVLFSGCMVAVAILGISYEKKGFLEQVPLQASSRQ